MSILTPPALFLLLVAVPIVLLYVLKLRREDRVVSSTILWRRAVEDLQANAPWQRLRPNFLLLLQLLAVVLLVLTVAQPAFTQVRTVTGDIVVILDQSYSMQARDGTMSRFDAALARTRTLAQSLGTGSVLSVIAMGAEPYLAVAESADQDVINHALFHLHAGNESPNFVAALSLAATLSRSGERTRTIVFTSRESGITGLPLRVSFPVDVVRLGTSLQDIGLTAFRSVRSNGRVEAVASVANFGSRPEQSDLDMSVDKQLVDVRPLRLSPGQQINVFWTDLPGNAKVVQAHLTQSDDLSIDKTAWAALNDRRARTVLLVSSGNVFLQTALTLDNSLHVTSIHPEVYTSDLAHGFDAVIFDGFLPPTLPTVPTLIVSPPRGKIGPFTFGKDQPVGQIVRVSRFNDPSLDPIIQEADFSDVHIARARSASLPIWLEPLVRSGIPLIAAGDSGESRLALISFDLQQSDWPLRVSFPVSIRGLLHYLAPSLGLSNDNVQVGQALSFFPEAGTREIEVIRPDGTSEQILSPFRTYTHTTIPGIYTVRQTGDAIRLEVRIAVNQFHPRTFPAGGPPVLSFGHAGGGGERTVGSPMSIAWLFGVAALVVLCAEWWVAFRR